MKRIILITITTLFLSQIIFAQDAKKNNSLSLSWGAGHFKEQDLIISPMIHKDFSPINAVIDYSHSGKLEHKTYLKIGIYNAGAFETYDYYLDTPDQMSTTSPNSNINLDLNYSIGKSLIERENLKLVLGGQFSNLLHASDNVIGASALFGYYFSFGLDFYTQLTYTLNNKHEFNAKLALPIFSFNARSPYSWMNDEYFEDSFSHKPLRIVAAYIGGGKLQSWGKTQSVDFDLSYYYALSETWSIGASYWYSLNTNQSPKKLVSIENVACLGVKYNF